MITSISTIFSEGQIYLWVYLYLATVMIIEISFENEEFSKWMGRIGAAVVILLIGFRWETGTDWLAYFKIFYTSDVSADYDSVVFGIDYGYIALNRIMYWILNDYTLFLLLDAAVAVGAVYFFIERSTRFPNMGVFLFYTSYAITHFMGSNRRMIAIGLVCLGLLHLRGGRRLTQGWPRWAAPFGLAASFHRTSVAALPALIVSRRSWPAPVVVLGLLACVALGMAGIPFAALEALGGALSQYAYITAIEKLLFYTSGAETQAAADFDVMGQAILGVAKRSTILTIFVAYMAMGKPSEYAQKLYNIYVVGCAIYFLMIGSPVFQVISTYYTIVEVALLPFIFSKLSELKVPYTFYLLAVPLLLLLSSLTPYLMFYVPYRSIFTTY